MGSQKKKKGGSKKKKHAVKKSLVNEKSIKAAVKEGGKKGQDISGLSEMGGVSFFHVSCDQALGNWELFDHALAGFNKVVDETAEDRKGGAGGLGKMLFSYDLQKLLFMCHVPQALQEEKKTSAQEWFDIVLVSTGGKLVSKSDDGCVIRGEVAADPDNNRYPIKMRDAAIQKGYDWLREKQLVLEDESDDDIVYGDDDFPDYYEEEKPAEPVAEEKTPAKPSIGIRERVTITKLFADPDVYIGKDVGVGGWVRTVRKGGGGSFAFVKVYDGTTGHELQLIVNQEVPGFTELTKENGVGCAVFAVGAIVESQGSQQKIEMKPTSVRIVGKCDAKTYPLAGKGLSLEYLRTIQHLRPRTAALGAVARVRNGLAFATHQFFQNQGYQYIHTPLITASDCEGGGEMFQVTTLIKDDDIQHKLPNGKADYSKDFFKRPAFLTVSGQLNAEIYATAMSSVYTFGPTFRAENSFTSRHLSEFWMIEPEIAFADLKEDVDIVEAFLKHTLRYVMEHVGEDLKILEDFEKKHLAERKKELQKEEKARRAKQAEIFKKLKAEGKEIPKQSKKKKAKKDDDWRKKPLRERLKDICDSEFARIDYTEAINLLLEAVENGHQFEEENMKIEWGMDMHSEHERYLCETLFKRPTVVMNYPKDIKAFYMRLNDDCKTVAAMDVLVPGVGELVGGSQREERYEVLMARLHEMGLKQEDYSWYLDLRKFGSVPHSGFGMGFERLVCYTTGMDNIREAIPFPRWPGHAEF